jgi:hypothetical protein
MAETSVSVTSCDLAAVVSAHVSLGELESAFEALTNLRLELRGDPGEKDLREIEDYMLVCLARDLKASVGRLGGALDRIPVPKAVA